MIKRFSVSNFKSLGVVNVDLAPVTVLIGRSGTGKSNFVQAIRWVRDFLTSRNLDDVVRQSGGWEKVLAATAQRPVVLSFTIEFDVPGFSELFRYDLVIRHKQDRGNPEFFGESLQVGERTIYAQSNGKWQSQPPLVSAPPAGGLMLGALTGIQEASVAYLVLTQGIGCYSFSDDVLMQPQASKGIGLNDKAENFLKAFTAITVNLSTWQCIRDIAASMRRLKPSLKSIDLNQPAKDAIVVNHEIDKKVLVFQLSQESEGFRRLLACLIALYQSPPKQTLIFDEPEKGIHPAGLSILADEFKGAAEKGRGQVLLTTHSPEFLDQFEADQIRVVEMKQFKTEIGPVAPEQLESLKERFMKPSELLTVDEARIAGFSQVG
ncbi:MAG: AAA family ATPase [Planctomycetia bacterium]|nr:AAA family ATPase [Planctomycetia bacterium]